jgi:hypothetical protein
LGPALPPDVVFVPWHEGLDVVGESEEGCRGGEDGVDLPCCDAVVDDGEETGVLGRVAELGGYLVDAVVEIGKGDLVGFYAIFIWVSGGCLTNVICQRDERAHLRDRPVYVSRFVGHDG